MRRSPMPVRARIHSSEVSTTSASSAFGITRSGRYLPHPLIRTYGLLLNKTTHNQGRVVPAEAERIRQRRVDALRSRHVRHVIEVAVRIGLLLIDRRGQAALQDGLD